MNAAGSQPLTCKVPQTRSRKQWVEEAEERPRLCQAEGEEGIVKDHQGKVSEFPIPLSSLTTEVRPQRPMTSWYPFSYLLLLEIKLT